jgi:L-ascorbate metabolism protein UlaG (beta-lactamase superfamily)
MQIGKINLDFLGHSGFLIKYANNEHVKIIAIDPYNIPDVKEKADFILITHSHYDHCSIKDIIKLARKGTTLIIPADVQSKITHIDSVQMETLESGEGLDLGIIKIEALPAYNVNKKFHTKKDNWLGYIIKIKETIIFHAGDSEVIPEYDKLTGYAKQGNNFIVLLPVSGTYVMSAEEAADLAAKLKPTLAIPMHFGAGVSGTDADAQLFVKLCHEKSIKAQILPKI